MYLIPCKVLRISFGILKTTLNIVYSVIKTIIVFPFINFYLKTSDLALNCTFSGYFWHGVGRIPPEPRNRDLVENPAKQVAFSKAGGRSENPEGEWGGSKW